MILPDVNVLIYAHRAESVEHEAYAAFLERLATGREPFALSELALSGFLRIVTHPRAFRTPSPWEVACAFVEELRAQSRAVIVRPGERHWGLFLGLCQASAARGKLVADAYHAALAIEHGCEFATTDSDFARFSGLRWRHPLRPGVA